MVEGDSTMDIKKNKYVWLMVIAFYLPCCAMKLEKLQRTQLCVSFEDMQANKEACLTLKNKIERLLRHTGYLPRTISTNDFLVHPVSKYFLSAIRNHEDALLKTCVLSTFNIAEVSLRSLSIGNENPLFFAVDFGIFALVDMLLHEGFEVDVKDSYGKTPLYYTLKNDNVELATLLLDAGASVAVQDCDGNTPLHCAIKYNNPEMIALLLSKKEVNPFITNGAGANVFFLANQYDFLRTHITVDAALITRNIEQRTKCIALLEEWKNKNPGKKGICFISEYY
ncbi:MAG: hypothetical protein US69_C0008G0030 [candidate division TM6 bacterium GW2011_GWF2_38_10]|nr:MAG: hypothetical protein US69_C0008G0030 [candidate division TM6 bacterium GW2011_GWF2_38_10]